MTFMVLFKTGTIEGYKATRFIIDNKELYIQGLWCGSSSCVKIPLENVERAMLNGTLIWADGWED